MLKIFELNWVNQGEKEWVAAETNIHALIVYTGITYTSLSDFDDEDFITEVPQEEWEKLSVRNTEFDESEPEDDDNFREMTFKKWIETHNSPDIIAGTMYE